MPVRKRSVSIHGHATSFSVEDEFFEALKALAEKRDQSVAALIAEIDEHRPRDANLSSAIRLFILNEARRGNLPLATDPEAQSSHQD